MIVKFKVLAVDPAARGMTVQYFTDAFPAGRTLNVTVYPDPAPEGADLDKYILSYAPIDWLRLQALPPLDPSKIPLAVEKALDTAILAPQVLNVKVL